MEKQHSKDKFIQVIQTLLYSWGGDPPQEAFWAANELLKWLQTEFDYDFDPDHDFFIYDLTTGRWNDDEVLNNLKEIL